MGYTVNTSWEMKKRPEIPEIDKTYTTEDQKKAEVALFISGNVDFNTKTVIGDEGHCIMINRSMQQEDITLVFMNLI